MKMYCFDVYVITPGTIVEFVEIVVAQINCVYFVYLPLFANRAR